MIPLKSIRGRDNNFDLIRILAAGVVLFVHSRALTGGEGYQNFAGVRDFTIGAIAVDVFFFTSGYLICGSLLSRGNIFDFVCARILRVFPALWAMMLLTVGALGLFVTTLSPAEFFSSPITHTYLWRGMTLVNGVKFDLPGLFPHNPIPNVANGSLWTLPVEWRLYEYMAGLWLVLSLKPSIRLQALRYGLPVAAVICAALVLQFFAAHDEREGVLTPQFMFFFGASLQIWRDKLFLSWRLLAGLLAALALTEPMSHAGFFLLYLLALGPVTLHVAFLIGGPIRLYNRLGDYSYGFYIYAFPIQQSLVHFFPRVSDLALDFFAGGAALFCAVLSWHFLEKPSLSQKDAAAQFFHRHFAQMHASLSARLARRRA